MTTPITPPPPVTASAPTGPNRTAPANAIRHLEFKVGLVLVTTALIAVAFLAYLLHARGVFETSHEFTLSAPDGSGVTVGMPLHLAGLPIGQVSRMTLTDAGTVAIVVRVRDKDLRWLRRSSTFSLEKNVLGSAKIAVTAGKAEDPPLLLSQTHPLQSNDIGAEIPLIIARVKGLVGNLEALSQPNASLARSIDHVATVTGRMTGEHGVIGGVLGAADAQKISTALNKTNALLDSAQGISLKMTDTLNHADQGVLTLKTTLNEARTSLKRVDDILAQAQQASAHVKDITGDVKAATRDLNLLRREVDDSLTKVNHLITELNRKWPFARNVELKTP